MWLTNSSIGRKVIMSVTGMALILFLTFHGCMNVVALISGEGYNMICRFLGSNWYAVVATIGLAALILIHIIYAFILTLQNRKARGNNRYKITEKPDTVEWSSQNMLVLGIVVLLGMLLHLRDFWYNMMFAELADKVVCPGPTNGFAWIVQTFDCSTTTGLVHTIIYVIWLAAIWFHLTHGFWSAIQTVGWSGHIWFKRWKVIGNIYVTLVMLMFLAVVVGFATKTAPSLNCDNAPAVCCKMQCNENECKADCNKCCEASENSNCEALEECECESKKAGCHEGESCKGDASKCCEKDEQCCEKDEQCCEEQAKCPGCGKETPCCTPGEPCQHCDAQNGECCSKPEAENADNEQTVAEQPNADIPADGK